MVLDAQTNIKKIHMSLLEVIKIKIKLPRVYIPLGVVVIAAFFFYRSYQAKNKPPEYETTAVARGTLTQTVEATGKLESRDDVSLRFETLGTLMIINAKEGDGVKTGAILASLRLNELNASVAQAAANLQQKRAGASDQDREYYRAAVDAAKAGLEQTKIDIQSSINNAGAAANTAYTNLKRAEGGDNSRIVNEAYENGVATLHSSIAKLGDAINQAQNTINYLAVIPVNDPAKKQNTDADFVIATQAVEVAQKKITGLTGLSLKSDIDRAYLETEPAFSKTIQSLAKIADLLNYIPPSTESATQTIVDAKKSAIVSARSSITTQYTSFLAQNQAIANAKNIYTIYSIEYQKAQQDLADAKAKAESTIQIKQSAYDQAMANYNGKILPTRAVDLAPYQAALSAALANREKAILRAPIDGVVAKINKKKGELVGSADAMIQMISPHFEIKVDVPETDIAKMINSQLRAVTFTLDAFGEETKFKGVVIHINQKSTEIQDVVYYQITIAVTNDYGDKKIQAGMTANAKIITEIRENTLFVPQRAIRTRDTGEKYIKILDADKKEQEKNIVLGLRADGGKMEILNGLNENDIVIIATKKK
ncbi:MAG: hypothetical protein A2983_03950 [Candidatus Magasanikbacteria bacterium RIFCSPLOWO2_01_FULL_40_15]|uniref:Multidrug resistance protein MdtA-like C-terminal permuted SH3 domain-containing protein n=1 Tax=Candidatus Magasanikbacteria bacterium RIFCSPLOWO2_01_FULL_40_15 TaxID=1798686 RepID=A0A1F6N0K9_9BACT|nr:MAG: hypothetical protein A2983_03950 [Candidatus Magasanikbacteria bacterium RIFCSPLOWO2_01_FULL_40_15]